MRKAFPLDDGTSSLTVNPRVSIPRSWLKAPRQGSSVGVHIIKDPAGLPAALEDCFRFGEEVLVEEFFPGRELTVGILGDEALPIIEIVPREGFCTIISTNTPRGRRNTSFPPKSAVKPPKPSSTPLFRPSAR